ncbi:MAG: DUF898 family protein [Devosia sp.]
MTTDSAMAGWGRVGFNGSRWELTGVILRGYLLMVPTIGIARFWQVTWKRRFYWQHTLLDGDPLEYTGHASQLLIGFLFALGFFLPVYVAFFYLSTRLSELALIGYGAIGAVLWFLSGYALYRGRDFRLSRTLWRGVRFDMRGNGWAYALRRFLWSLLALVTLGLAYPFMAASLWRFRTNNTWFGDRPFTTSASWRHLALPYYGGYFLNALLIGGIIGYAIVTRDFVQYEGRAIPGPMTVLLSIGELIVLTGSIAFYRARAASRLLSSITIGEAALQVRVRARDLFGQYIGYAAALVGLVLLLGIIALIAAGSIVAAATASGDGPDPAAVMSFFQSGTLNVAMLAGAYLLVLGTFGLLNEIILSVGWWKLLARGTIIVNSGTLRSVRAAPEDRSLIGEGLADALNVGAY